MQENPLLEQLDWFFTSSTWINDYPNTMVHPLARTASDHVPCVVSIATTMPKAKIFRFENYWVDLRGFFDCVEQSWNAPTMKSNSAARLTEKFKRLRYALKHWYISLSKLKKAIEACNQVVMFFDNMEELRTLTRPEFNFRKIVKLHVEDLLHLQFIYWKQRCTIRWIKVGEENSIFFKQWPLKGLGETLFPPCKMMMEMLSLIINKWLVCYRALLKSEWVFLQGLI